jgi:hypothetical protein
MLSTTEVLFMASENDTVTLLSTPTPTAVYDEMVGFTGSTEKVTDAVLLLRAPSVAKESTFIVVVRLLECMQNHLGRIIRLPICSAYTSGISDCQN